MHKFTKADLGKLARDRVTGFEGRVMAVCHYWTGCDQVMLTPDTVAESDGTRLKSEWFDDVRLEIDSSGDAITLPGAEDIEAGEATGGPSTETLPASK